MTVFQAKEQPKPPRPTKARRKGKAGTPKRRPAKPRPKAKKAEPLNKAVTPDTK